MRTNIVIDDELMEKAMKLSGLNTKKDVVREALTEYVNRRTRKDLSDLRGKIRFADNYDYKSLRKGRRNDSG
ncbi:MAG: type II toxin-antitoxin system VapB family antitoxin [Firmicutes bacterium]|nr:type II toxin-antitoxin system VapB family antitoxin [Bacillota bacterium]